MGISKGLADKEKKMHQLDEPLAMQPKKDAGVCAQHPGSQPLRSRHGLIYPPVYDGVRYRPAQSDCILSC